MNLQFEDRFAPSLGRPRRRGDALRHSADLPPAKLADLFLQDDMSVANGPGATVRTDMNNQFQSLQTMNSGTAAPSTTFGNMLWADTTNTLAKKRNNANAAWNTFADLDFTHWLLGDGTVGAPAYSFNTDTDCGMYRIGTNNVGIGVNGAKVLDIGTAGLGVTGTLSATGTTTLAKVTGTLVYAGTTGVTTNMGAGTPLSGLAGGNGDFIVGLEHTHSTGPSGIYMIYTNSNPNDANHPFFRFDSAGSSPKALLYSNGGLANFSANNVNLSDLKVKPTFELLFEKGLIPDLWAAHKEMRNAWGRYKYDDQTHDDWNWGYGAQYIRAAFAGVAEELVGDWGHDDLLAVYQEDLHNISGAVLTEAQFRIDDHEVRIAELVAANETLRQQLATAGIPIH